MLLNLVKSSFRSLNSYFRWNLMITMRICFTCFGIKLSLSFHQMVLFQTQVLLLRLLFFTNKVSQDLKARIHALCPHSFSKMLKI